MSFFSFFEYPPSKVPSTYSSNLLTGIELPFLSLINSKTLLLFLIILSFLIVIFSISTFSNVSNARSIAFIFFSIISFPLLVSNVSKDFFI